jgi:hypothetical protein
MPNSTGPGAFSGEDFEAIYGLVTGDLSREFQVAVEDAVSRGYRPETPLDREMLGQWQQHLLDLGYLAEADAGADRYTAEVMQAIDSFCRDDPTLTRPDVRPASNGGSIRSNLEIPVEHVGAVELDRLTRLTAFEGLSLGAEVPGRGEQGLIGRILHFRLKVLGLYGRAVDAPVSKHTTDALRALERTIGPVGDSENIIDLLADPERLEEKYLAHHQHEPLVFRHPSKRPPAAVDYERLAIVDGRFLSTDNEWTVLEHRDSQIFRQLQEQLEHRSSPAARKMVANNRFGLQLIQVQLWKHGFYEGRLDGWWGALTVEALEEALEFEGIPVDEVLRPLGQGYFALNFWRLHERLFMQLDRAESDLNACREYIMQESIYLGEQEKYGGLFRRVWGSVRDNFQEAIAAGRRIYRGVNTLVKSAANALLKGFNWIRGELQHLVAPVANFLRLCSTTIRDGIHTAVQAVQKFFHFVLGKPLAVHDEADCIFVRFDRDLDPVLFVSDDASSELCDHYHHLLRGLSRAIEPSLLVAARVIRYLCRIAAGPPGWLRLAFEVGTIVRQSISEPPARNQQPSWL